MKREHKIYRWGEELTAFAPRIPGTGNMDLARDYICEKLKSFGIEPELEAINFRGVFHQSWSLDIIAPFQKAITCYPENNVGFGDLAAELVDVGFGNAEDYKGRDVKGKIVLVNWGDLTRHELDCGLGKRYPLLGLYDNAWENGAAGMIGYFTDTPGNALKVLEPGIKITGGSNITGPAEAGDNNGFLLPAVTIGRLDALSLKKELKKAPLSLKLLITGKRKVSTVWTITGSLKGKSSSSILVGSHYCTAFSGAICDTAGVVGALALAEHFSGIPLEKRPKTLHFIFSGTHVWQNCNIASLRYIKANQEKLPDITAMLWMDHISAPPASGNKNGEKREKRLALTSGNGLLYFLTLASMIKNRRFPLALPLSRLWTLCEMGPFDNLGIPSMCIQALNDDLLTTEDTWDKIDPKQLGYDINVYIHLAEKLQKIPGRLLRRLEIPGKSLFGCGTLFSDTTMPDYPKGEVYSPEEPPPLYYGGADGIVSITYK